MRKKLLVLSIVLMSIGCAAGTRVREERGTCSDNEYFPSMSGCFVLYNLRTGVFEKVINEQRARERFVPYSTFKIPLSVMALDSGVLTDENVVLTWDGKRGPREVANRDHDAKSWMRESIVWFSQRLTRELGEKRISKYLEDFRYGNADASAGVDGFWLTPPDADMPALRISAYEQVEFLRRLWKGELPASERSMRITRALTYLETSDRGFRLCGKTGSCFWGNGGRLRFGWFVAYVARGDREYIAVTNFADLSPASEHTFGGVKAKEITKQILKDLGLW